MSKLALALALALSVAGCSKDEGKKADEVVGTVGPDGVRRIPIEAGKGGYKPDRIKAKPGEKLVLVFTRTVEGECLSQVKVAGGEAKDLPMNTPVEIAVTAPESGKLEFACGMDMQTGVIAVN
jgi:plastocyanin domain-containing protein